MTVSHRATVSQPHSQPTADKPEKVARMACCCKLSELLPLVRQLHHEAARGSRASLAEQQAA